ncbi:MAG TPA: DedA family protein [Aurantimonas coralicida]|uniref:DedA family protein n=2 Tax=root TaxID=1 RepID=A0A9C9TGE8_9HYPH|nr:DedA family protein [Aurantimonas coralicida]HEU00049.1 DedA family protein [Aurantimonas coralicida]
MTEIAFGLVSTYGTVLILLATYLSCLGLPVPTSFVMLAGGAFVASGDLVATNVLTAALAGSLLGDQTGYHLGRIGGEALTARLEREPHRALVFARARRIVDRWGGVGVFFSTWLVSPLGPYVNLLAGATRMSWMRFMLWDSLGEAIWVAVYLGLGYAFSGRIAQLASLLGNSIAFLTAAVITLLLGRILVRRLRLRGAS